MKRKLTAMALIGALVIVSGCSNGSSSEDSTTTLPGAPTSTTAPQLLDDQSIGDVLFAGLVLELGDFDVALTEGLITPNDVVTAAEAINDDTMERIVDGQSGK